jgi:hypothetical protein
MAIIICRGKKHSREIYVVCDEWMEKGRKEKCRKGKISKIKMSKKRI